MVKHIQKNCKLYLFHVPFTTLLGRFLQSWIDKDACDKKMIRFRIHRSCNMFLTTDNLDPNRKQNIEKLDEKLLAILPTDYIHFLTSYGIGTYCDEVYIIYPDEENIPLTFADYIDLWELDEDYNVADLLSSTQIGSTANGDIICVTANRIGKIFVLPRHDIVISSFNSFEETIKSFVANIATHYFDPIFESTREQISLIKASSLIDILPIQAAFLQKFNYDFVTNEDTQPKYFIKRIGGWISFDLIYKNSISIKYQVLYVDEALSLIDFLKKQLHGDA